MDTDRQLPINHTKELSLEHIEFVHGHSTYFRIDGVHGEHVAKGLACDSDGRDDEAMAGQGGQSKQWCACAYLVDIMQCDQ